MIRQITVIDLNTEANSRTRHPASDANRAPAAAVLILLPTVMSTSEVCNTNIIQVQTLHLVFELYNYNMAISKKKRKVKLNMRGKAFLAGFVVLITVTAIIIITLGSKESGSLSQQETVIPPLETEASETTESEAPTPTPYPVPQLDLLGNIYSNYAILIDAETGTVICEKNADTQAFPASVTKMMTLLVACEQLSDYDEVYPLTRDIYDTLYYQDLAAAGYECDEPVTVNDLLYGLMLRSGAECCLGLAKKISGDEQGFVALMNARAAELGMTGTNFTNCTGLHNAAHYSTVRDMAVLLRAGLQNDKFREVFSTTVYTSTPTVYHPGGLTIYSTFYQTLSSMDFEGGSFIGGKTGYTGEAGQCLASAATIAGREYIFVTFGAYRAEGDRSSHLHTVDAINTYQALAAAL